MREAYDLAIDGNDLNNLAESILQRIRAVYEIDVGYVNFKIELDKISEMN